MVGILAPERSLKHEDVEGEDWWYYTEQSYEGNSEEEWSSEQGARVFMPTSPTVATR